MTHLLTHLLTGVKCRATSVAKKKSGPGWLAVEGGGSDHKSEEAGLSTLVSVSSLVSDNHNFKLSSESLLVCC